MVNETAAQTVAEPPQATGVKPIDVGIYFDLRNPPQWRQDPSQLYGFALEMCEEAEHLGAGSAWFSEHHLFVDDYLPSPLTFAAAAAARTKRIRLGTAIVIAPLHHPAELAEQCAVVDVISNGRLDLGLGTGYRVPEFDLFGATLEKKYAQTDAMVGKLRELWSENGIRPGPVQNPMPIWMGYQGPQGARRAGRLGERLLSPAPDLWQPYREGLVEGGHSLDLAHMAGGLQAWVTEDPEADWAKIGPYVSHQLNSYRQHMVEGTGQAAPKPVDLERLRQSDRTAPLKAFRCDTPEEIAGWVRESAADMPLETVFLWASIGGMPQDMVAQHVQTICGRLGPLLRGEQPGSN